MTALYYQPGYQDAKHVCAISGDTCKAWHIGDAFESRPSALIGSIEWTYAALDALGIARPAVISYETFPRMQHQFRRSTMQCAASWLKLCNFPLFVKPAEKLKLFPAKVYDEAEFQALGLTPQTMCDASEPVEFSDEFRTFWRRGGDGQWHLEGGADYPMIEETPPPLDVARLGDIAPHPDLPRDTITIDVGTIDKGKPSQRQAIVELGDMFAMGTYGADAAYFRCHQQWLAGLVAK